MIRKYTIGMNQKFPYTHRLENLPDSLKYDQKEHSVTDGMNKLYLWTHPTDSGGTLIIGAESRDGDFVVGILKELERVLNIHFIRSDTGEKA